MVKVYSPAQNNLEDHLQRVPELHHRVSAKTLLNKIFFLMEKINKFVGFYSEISIET